MEIVNHGVGCLEIQFVCRVFLRNESEFFPKGWFRWKQALAEKNLFWLKIGFSETPHQVSRGSAKLKETAIYQK